MPSSKIYCFTLLTINKVKVVYFFSTSLAFMLPMFPLFFIGIRIRRRIKIDCYAVRLLRILGISNTILEGPA